MTRRRSALLVLVGALSFATQTRSIPASAEPTGAPRPRGTQEPGAHQFASPSASPSSLHRLAIWARSLGGEANHFVAFGPLANAPPSFTEQAQRNLHEELLRSVGAAVVGARFQDGPPISFEDARRLARTRNLPLLYFAPRWAGTDLELSATVTHFPRSFWQKARFPRGHVREKTSARVPIDALLRKYMPSSSWSTSRVVTWKLPIYQPLALACGTLFAKEELDVVVVGRSGLASGPLRDDTWTIRDRVSLADLTNVAPAPLRAPLAGVVLNENSIRVGLSDRAEGLVLDERLKLRKKVPRGQPVANGACSAYSSRGLFSPTADCRPPADSTQWDVLSEATFVEPTGAVSELFGRIPLGSSSLELSVRSPTRGTKTYTIEASGGPVLFGDVDGDGTVDVLSTTASESERDSVRIHSLKTAGPVEVSQLPFDEIRAMALCPFDGENPRKLLVATDDELHLVRP